MTMPAVTIVLPVFNASPYLHDCLISIANQTFEDWTLVALDDGSDDNSLDILNEFKDSRIRILHHDRNLGPSLARNTIIDMSTTEFIALQDADDFMHTDRLKIQVQLLRNSPDVDVTGTFMNLVGKDGLSKGTLGYAQNNYSLLRLLFTSPAPAHATLVGRRSWFQRNPYPNNFRRGEDKYMIARALKNNDFKYLLEPRPLYFYRDSSRDSGPTRRQAYIAERRALKTLIDTWVIRKAYVTFSYTKTLLSYFRFSH